MTPYDLLFFLVAATATVTLIAAFVIALGGKFSRALKLVAAAVATLGLYVSAVYAVTALSTQRLIPRNSPFCNDDWCLTLNTVNRTTEAVVSRYDITLTISSRARSHAQRENSATDVFLEDSQGRRLDPLSGAPEVPLNVLLQPGQAVKAQRHFDVPIDAQGLHLGIGRLSVFPFCVVIGECEAFGKGMRFLLN